MGENIFDIKDKVCLINGAAGLLGSSFSSACAENGAIVVAADIDSKKGEMLVKKIILETKNENVAFQKCDITKEISVKGAIRNVLKKYGRIDALINSAYPKNKNYGKKFENVNYKDFCKNVSLHLGGYFLMTKEVSNIMIKQKRGNIIFMGSIYGFAAPKFKIYSDTEMTMPVEYSAIKGGVINMARYLASYLGDFGIRVNTISPGGVFNNQKEQFVKKYIEHIHLGEKRMAKPEDISNALLFLISDASSYMTGQNIIVDGGWTI